MRDDVSQMKWWGWGDEHKEFDASDKPFLMPFITRELGLSEADEEVVKPVSIEEVKLPAQSVNQGFLDAARSALREDQVKTSDKERLVHSYGKSFRDLWRVRRGILDSSPDCVIYPESEDDVCALMKEAKEHDVVLIPFGGGSNIAGCLENRETNSRMVVSLDMKRMDRVLDVDKESCVARIQAGSSGPIMEEQLEELGFTLGHFPDSFEFSTVGGWVATRAAGMQSAKYGKIEDMVLSVRMVTPSGVLVTRTVPKSSNGIDVNQICIGSEGILGVITEISLQVHRLPEKKEFYGYLFPDFESGVKAMRQCVDEDCMPTIARLNDPGKTALSFAFKSPQPLHKELMGKVVKKYLAVVRGFDMDKVCLMIMAVEGDNRTFRRLRSGVHAIYRKHGAFKLGISPGRAFQESKYDFPYLRDFAMDRGVVCDVSETSTVWSNLLPLYHSTIESITTAIEGTGVAPFAGCHISHCYHTGTSLYFTFACMENESGGLGQYLLIKKAAEDAFLRGGATLSHHHAVGFEHAPWLEEDISETGVLAVRSVKEGLDPGGVMNPGKILPDGRPFEGWGLEGEEVESLEGTGS